MASTKFELDKLNGKNDFNVWRIKINVLMVCEGIYVALDKEAMAMVKDNKVVLEI